MYSKTKKICILIPGHYSDVMGGAQYQAKCLIDYMHNKKSHELYYIARNVDPKYKPNHYTIKKIPAPFGRERARLFMDALSLLNILKEIQPDVIYQRVASAYTGIGAYYARHNDCKIVWHISSDADVSKQKIQLKKDMISRYIDQKFLQYGIRNVDRIIAQTNTQAQILSDNYQRKVDAIIPNFHPLPTEEITKLLPIKVVWIANLKKIKQPEIFIKLAKDLEHINNVEFIMIGSMQGSSKWAENIRQSIKDAINLKYVGETSQSQVNAVLANSHILVNTSEYEGFSNTFIQAWMRMVPVVSLNVNPDKLLDNGKLGFCSGTYKGLLENVLDLIRNHSKREAIGKSSRDYALKNHSEKNAEELILMLEAD